MGPKADEHAISEGSAEAWRVRPGLKYVWKVPEKCEWRNLRPRGCVRGLSPLTIDHWGLDARAVRQDARQQPSSWTSSSLPRGQ